ncbi:MAG: hypothetical protein NVS3B20_00090 [Polyangiales bacterium]
MQAANLHSHAMNALNAPNAMMAMPWERTLEPWWLLAVAAVLAVVCIVIGLLLARFLRGRESRVRNRIAHQGERDAEAILMRDGYRIVERQARARWSMTIDGVAVPIDVRADLLVRREGRTYVAEVKTGRMAPDPRYPPTRRQLLEYALVFGGEEVLLVDVEEGVVRSIGFQAQGLSQA